MGDLVVSALTPFNTPFEAGVRSLCVLTEAFPKALDLPQLVELDYLIVHSGDVGGPPSLHAPVPLRSGEILVRRGLVESGLLLMTSRGLVERNLREDGLYFCATELSAPFVTSLGTRYNRELRERAVWAVSEFTVSDGDDLRTRLSGLFDNWSPQFHVLQGPAGT